MPIEIILKKTDWPSLKTCYFLESNLQRVYCPNEDTKLTLCTLIFLFFSIKGQNGCMNRLMQTTAKKNTDSEFFQ